MRTLLLITITLFSMAGCLDGDPRTDGDPGTDDPPAAPDPSYQNDDNLTIDDSPRTPAEVKHCVSSYDCWEDDPDTEYRLCDLFTWTCVKSPYPF